VVLSFHISVGRVGVMAAVTKLTYYRWEYDLMKMGMVCSVTFDFGFGVFDVKL